MGLTYRLNLSDCYSFFVLVEPFADVGFDFYLEIDQASFLALAHWYHHNLVLFYISLIWYREIFNCAIVNL